MALVPDINGVCKVLGTLEITENPTNPDNTRIARLANSWSYISVVPLTRDAGLGDYFVVEIRCQRAVLDQQIQQSRNVFGVQLAGVFGHRGRQVQRRGD